MSNLSSLVDYFSLKNKGISLGVDKLFSKIVVYKGKRAKEAKRLRTMWWISKNAWGIICSFLTGPIPRIWFNKDDWWSIKISNSTFLHYRFCLDATLSLGWICSDAFFLPPCCPIMGLFCLYSIRSWKDYGFFFEADVFILQIVKVVILVIFR